MLKFALALISDGGKPALEAVVDWVDFQSQWNGPTAIYSVNHVDSQGVVISDLSTCLRDDLSRALLQLLKQNGLIKPSSP